MEEVVYLFVGMQMPISNRLGNLVTFSLEDSVHKHYLSKMIVPNHLGLKIGMKVILLTNLSNDLVNGTVNKIEDDAIHVLFHINEKEIICPIKKILFNYF